MYTENTLITLKHKHSRDEDILFLFTIIKKQDIAIGKLQSTIDELKFNITNKQEINRLSKIEARKEELYENLREKDKTQQKKIKSLNKTINNLIINIYQPK
jgi:hypothetical protein